MDKINIVVEGIGNANSKNAIKEALTEVEGVNMVNIDLERNSVEVDFGEPVSEVDIRLCIENMGFNIGAKK